MDYVCNLFCCRKIQFQLVTALIVVLLRYAYNFTCDVLSQYNSDYFNSWACFFYETIEFEFGVFFTSGKRLRIQLGNLPSNR